jgi:signal peptidase I
MTMRSPISIFRIEGNSMEPTYRSGDYVLVCQAGFSPKKGDVVVLQRPGARKLIKRVDRIGPEGIFVIGDNASMSTDSREFGAIAASDVTGKVLLKL